MQDSFGLSATTKINMLVWVFVIICMCFLKLEILKINSMCKDCTLSHKDCLMSMKQQSLK